VNTSSFAAPRLLSFINPFVLIERVPAYLPTLHAHQTAGVFGVKRLQLFRLHSKMLTLICIVPVAIRGRTEINFYFFSSLNESLARFPSPGFIVIAVQRYDAE
jgi:hypothetical protein